MAEAPLWMQSPPVADAAETTPAWATSPIVTPDAQPSALDMLREAADVRLPDAVQLDVPQTDAQNVLESAQGIMAPPPPPNPEVARAAAKFAAVPPWLRDMYAGFVIGGAELVSAGANVMSGLGRPGRYLSGKPEGGDPFELMAAKAHEDAKAWGEAVSQVNAAEGVGSTGQTVRRVVGSIIPMAAKIGTGAAIPIFGAETWNSARRDALAQGASERTANLTAAPKAALAMLGGHVLSKIPGLGQGAAVPAASIGEAIKKFIAGGSKDAAVLGSLNIANIAIDKFAGLNDQPVTMDMAEQIALESSLTAFGLRGFGVVFNKVGGVDAVVPPLLADPETRAALAAKPPGAPVSRAEVPDGTPRMPENVRAVLPDVARMLSGKREVPNASGNGAGVEAGGVKEAGVVGGAPVELRLRGDAQERVEAASGAGEVALPRDLAGAKPAYGYGSKQFTLRFESDLDKAAYILAQPKRSKADQRYLQWFMAKTGATEEQARQAGQQVRGIIKGMARDAQPGELVVLAAPPDLRAQHKLAGEAMLAEDMRRAAEPPRAPPPSEPPLPPSEPPRDGAIPVPPAPEQRPFGRPELANKGTEAPQRTLVDLTDEGMVRRGVLEGDRIVVDQVRKAAQADIAASGPDAAVVRLNKLPVDAWTTKDNLAFEELLNTWGREAIAKADPKRMDALVELSENYRRGGTKQAQALQSRRDRVMGPAERLSLALFELPEYMKAREARADDSGRPAEAKRVRDEWKAKLPDITKKLKERGVDLSDPTTFTDNTKAATAYKEIHALKGTVWDAIHEFQYDMMLMNPTGMAADTAGGIAYTAYRRLLVKPVEALLEGGPRGMAREVKLATSFDSMRRAWERATRNWMETQRTELPSLEVEAGRKGTIGADTLHHGIGGKPGRALRWASTTRMANDEFVKSFAAQYELASMAKRIAGKEGLKGDAFDSRVDALMADKTSKAWDEALWEAKESTFQHEPGPWMKAGIDLVRKPVPLDARVFGGARPLTFIFPFLKTPANIVKTGLRLSPLGAIPAGWKAIWRTDPHWKTYVAEQMVGATIMGTLYAAYDYLKDKVDWDEVGDNLTPAGKAMSYRTGRQPLSVAVPLTDGGRASYGRIEPLATTAPATLALIYGARALAKGDGDGAMRAAKYLASTVENKTYFQSLANLTMFASDPTPGGASRYVSQIIGSFSPALLKQYQRATQETMPERKVWGQGKEFAENAAKRLGETMVESAGTTGVDLWGRDKKRAEGPAAYKMVSPVDLRTEDMTLGDKVFFAYNKTAKKDYYPPESKPDYKWNGETVFMDDAQFRQFRQLAGQAADKAVHLLKPSVDAPTEDDIDAIKHIITKTRTMAEGQLANEWHGGIKAAPAERIANAVYTDMLKSAQEWTAKDENGSPKKKMPRAPTPTQRAKGMTLSDVRAEWIADKERALAFLRRR